jgi:hypothetical protein
MKESILEEARQNVCGDRNTSYGPPIEDFECQAVMMSAYLTRTNGYLVNVRASDIASLMILVKVARQAHCSKRDNWVDMAGYAACGGEVNDTEIMEDRIRDMDFTNECFSEELQSSLIKSAVTRLFPEKARSKKK